MRLYYPDIFERFRCTGSKCRDNCCKIGWDIEIDPKTVSFYRSLDSGLGRRLVKSIYKEDGCFYMRQQNGCPFLNENGLCSVELEYGEEHISDICREHPRFYEWFGDFKEAGVGLSCEEVCRLLTEHDKPIIFTEREIDEPDDDLEFNEKIFPALRKIRNRFIEILQNRGYGILQRLGILLYSCEDVQEAVDLDDSDRLRQLSGMLAIEGFLLEIVNEANAVGNKEQSYRSMLEIYTTLDYIGEGLKSRFEETLKRLPQILSKEREFDEKYADSSFELEHIAVYFIYRYLIKAARDTDVVTRIYSAILSTLMIRFLFMAELEENGTLPEKELRAEIIKEYSKEIEYSTENTDVICDKIARGDISFDMLEDMLFGG